MAIVANFYAMDNKEGVDLNRLQTSVDVNTDPSVPAPRAKLGDRVQGNMGSEWCFVIASATVTAFNVITINRNYGANNITTATQVSGIYTFGIAEFQGLSTDGTSLLNAQPGDYFWAMIKVQQGARVNVVSTVSVPIGAKLYVSGDVPGQLTSSVTASNGILQLVGIFPPISATSGSSLGIAVTPTEVGMYTYMYPAAIVSAQTASV